LPIDPPLLLNDSEELRMALRSAAIAAELLDEREAHYLSADLGKQLELLRSRWYDLQDAPPGSDAERFPNRNTCGDQLALNRNYRQHMEAQVRTDETREALSETDQLHAMWEHLRDARCEYYYVTVRRQALKRLREQIGEDAYYMGRLPPPVPLHWFQQIR